MDRELLKQALKKKIKTYPISRAWTSPKGWGLTLSTAMGLPLIAAGAPVAPAVAMAGMAGGMGYGLTRLLRFMHARGLHSRLARGAKTPWGITGSEAAAAKDILKAKLKKTSAVKYPISEIMTSRAAWSGLNLAQAVAGNPAAAVGIVTAPIGTHAGRAIHARALRGRLARGGKGLYGEERKLVQELQGVARHQKARKALKATMIGAGVAGTGYAGTKALAAATAD